MDYVYFGRFYRVDRSGKIESNFSGQYKPKKYKKSKTDNYGGFYLTCSIDKGHRRVHLLMWEMWKGPRAKGKIINHIDGDRENCAIDSLEEINQKANMENVIARGNFKLFGVLYDPRTKTAKRGDAEGISSVVGQKPTSVDLKGYGPEYLDSCKLPRSKPNRPGRIRRRSF